MRDSIILYRSLREATKQLDLETRAKVYDAVMDYAFDGVEPQESGVVQAMFLMMKPIIDTNNQRFENGCKGGRPKNQTITKTKPNENQNETKPEPNKDKDVDVYITPPNNISPPRFKKPTLDEIKTYNQQTGLGVDEQAFMDFYESKGWKVGSSAMKDWKAALRNWARRDRQPANQYEPTEMHETEKLDPVFYVDNQNFFIDDTMDCYKDALVGVPQETIERVWKWIVDNKSGKAVTASWVIERIKQFMKDEVPDPSKVINLSGVLKRVG